jgi:lipopolysaccharide transport system ATP-binding protein
VFVSHNLNAVQRLCNRALLIESGRLELEGGPSEVIARYLERWGPVQSGGTAVLADDMPRNGNGRARLRRVTLSDLAGNELSALHLGQPFRVRFLLEAFEAIPDAVFELGVNGADGERVATAQNIDGERLPAALTAGIHELDAELRMTLLPGEYSLTLAVHHRSGRTLDYVDQALGFSVLNSAETGDDNYPWPDVRGYVRPDSEWSVGVPV